MSLVNLSHVCSHLQNASLARLGLTSVPLTRLHLNLSLLLQKQGFISSVDIGGPRPPRKHLPAVHEQPSSLLEDAHDTAAYETQVQEQEESESVVTQANRASRRLWLGLKYWDGEPVLSKMNMLSKPTRRIHLSAEDLQQVVRGRQVGYVKGLTRIGECMFVSTDKGIMEARDCAERRIGGLMLCRAW